MKQGHVPKVSFLLAAVACVLLFMHAAAVFATPEFARQSGLDCIRCHTDGIGGSLTEEGKKFLGELKEKGLYHSPSFPRRIVRLVIGYLHMMAAIIWFGTIMYVHILLKPAYASKGLPKGELRLGLISMVTILVTGSFLTIARIPTLEILYTTRFGILLSIKIFLFMIMFTSAMIVATYIRPRLSKKMQSPVADLFASNMTAEQLGHFDGQDGRPAYIAYRGIVYDVTGAHFWKDGKHAMKHPAGNDLTENLKTAPHGEDKVLAMPQVGTLLLSAMKLKQPFAVRLFYFFAYMNLDELVRTKSSCFS